MIIDEDEQRRKWLMESEETKKALTIVDEIKRSDIPTNSRACPHCGNMVFETTIARRSDLEAFETLMSEAQKLLENYGYMGILLAELHAKITISIAKNKAKN
jgi:mevalonate kinase